jgi:hypothetical protein
MATVAPVRESRRGHASANTTAEARIGPNAVLQTLGALEDAEGHKMARRLHVLAAIPPTPTDAMIPEAHFVALVAAVRETLPPARAEAVLAESGRRTAAYVSAHRIPGFAHTVLAGLPTRLALPALLSAIGQHAWTFAGAGVFAVEVRIVLIHPNYHSGGAEIAGQLAARLGRLPRGALKKAGTTTSASSTR